MKIEEIDNCDDLDDIKVSQYWLLMFQANM